jgi:hypothetical protein
MFGLLLWLPILVPLAAIALPGCAALGGAIAERKRRDSVEGYLLGLLLGPIGVIVAGALPGRRTSVRATAK